MYLSQMGVVELFRPIASIAFFVIAMVAFSACGSSDEGSSTSTANRQASASSEVVRCPNKRSSTRYLGFENTTGIPLKITAGTANCVAFSETGNPTGINAGIVQPLTDEEISVTGDRTRSATQRLEMVPCSSQTDATTCVWDAGRKAYTDDCTPWDLTIARGDADPGRVLGTVAVHYCGLSKTDQTVQIRLNEGDEWGSTVRFDSVVEAKPVYVTAERSWATSSSTTFTPLLTVSTR